MTTLSVVVAVVAIVGMVGLVRALGVRFDRVNVGLLAAGSVGIVVVLMVWPLH